jgi:quinolinate synthase
VQTAEIASNIVEEIKYWKEVREAAILAHNYQLPEVQDVADHVGDSLELARYAANTKAKTIVLCGVKFMAETAAILNPDKTVLIPDPNAGLLTLRHHKRGAAQSLEEEGTQTLL